jgi:hypothetical protein
MRNIALLLITALALNSSALAFQTAQASETKPQTKEEREVASVKAEVQKRGIGEKSRVKIKLKNKTEVKGYISKIDETAFDVTDKHAGRATTISYADVEKVQGAGLSKGAKIGIAVGVAAAAAAILFVIALIIAGRNS